MRLFSYILFCFLLFGLIHCGRKPLPYSSLPDQSKETKDASQEEDTSKENEDESENENED